MFVIYIFSDFTRVRLRGKRMKNIPRSWVWADRFPFNDLFHAIIYFIAWINVDSSLSRGHWKLENCSRAKRERQFFLIFSNFLYFKEKIFYYSIKKKIPSNFIDKFPLIHRANQCYHMPLNIRKLMQDQWREFFFSNFTRVPFPKETLRKFDKNFIEFSFIDLRLFPLSHRWFTVLISHRIPENYIRRG